MKSARDDQSEPAAPQSLPLRLRFDLVNVALATAVVVLVVQAFTLIDLARHVLLLLILSILAATAIEPLVLRLRRSGIGRGPTVLGVYVAIIGLTIAFGIFAIRAMAGEVSSLAKAFPTLSERLGSLAASLPAGPLQNAAKAAIRGLEPDQLGPLISSIFTVRTVSEVIFVTTNAFDVIISIVTVFVITYFWLAEKVNIRRLVLRSIPKERRLKALEIWQDVEAKFGAWVRGQIVLMLIIGLAQGIGYIVFGLPFALLFAVFAGLAEAIPMVGPYLGAIPAVLVALALSPRLALILTAYTVVLHLIESNMLVPRIMQHAVGLSPLAVLVALLAGAAIGGLTGALLAIPIAAAIQVVVVDLMKKPGAPTPSDAATPEGVEPPE